LKKAIRGSLVATANLLESTSKSTFNPLGERVESALWMRDIQEPLGDKWT